MEIFINITALRGNSVSLIILEISLYLLNFVLGGLVGVEFPAANALMEKAGKEAGGMLYALDLLGAFIGSIVFVTLIFPLIGFLLLFLLVALFKFINMLLIFFVSKS